MRKKSKMKGGGGRREQSQRKKLGRQTLRKDADRPITHTDHDFVLSGEVGRLAQQLALRHGDRAGSLSYQHGVVKLHPS